MLKDLRISIFALLDKMNAIDFSGISKHTIATLDSVQKRLNDPALARIITNLDKASANLEHNPAPARATMRLVSVISVARMRIAGQLKRQFRLYLFSLASPSFNSPSL